MLAACVEQGWPVATYTEPDHPLQTAIASHMVDVLGAATLPVGVDGCGTPVFRCTTESAATGFLRLLTEPRYETVRTAMCRYPVLASGPGLPDAEIAIWLGGLAKRGAEGCLGVALPDRGVVFLKVWDGAARGVGPAALSALDHLGWIPDGCRKQLESSLVSQVLGGGEAVGFLDGVFDMEHL
jgi:L-asparaginase II